MDIEDYIDLLEKELDEYVEKKLSEPFQEIVKDIYKDSDYKQMIIDILEEADVTPKELKVVMELIWKSMERILGSIF